MKFLLLNPPSYNGFYTNRDLMGGHGVNVVGAAGFFQDVMARIKARSIRIPVLPLVYCASILAEENDVSVLDAANLEFSDTEVETSVCEYKPDWIISASSTSTFRQELALLQRLKKLTGAKVVLFGEAVSTCPDSWIVASGIDYVICGTEPEMAIRVLSKTHTLDDVAGVRHVCEGGLKSGNGVSLLTDLDQVPLPRWDLFPVDRYRYFPAMRKAPFVTAQASRGCPYGCIYCPYTSGTGSIYRKRSISFLMEELNYLKERCGVGSVLFRDPTFTMYEDRIIELCDQIIAEKIELELGCETRIDCLSEKLIDRMAEAGFTAVNVGIESIDPNIIHNAKREWIPPERIERTIQHMRRLGIRVSGFFVLGLPGETPETMEKTLNFSKKLPLSYAEFKIATPFPGTPLLELALQNHWISESRPEKYSSYSMSMNIHSELTEEYMNEALSRAYRGFYLSPRRLCGELLSEKFFQHVVQIIGGR